MPRLRPDDVRSETDRVLHKRLVEDSRVQELQKLQEEAPRGTRRQLLARALRLTPRTAPELHDILNHCIERLEVEAEVELFVHASPMFNAGCTPVENGRVFVLFTSALIEAFEAEELRFITGHELGHHIYGHHQIPLHLILHNAQHLSASLVLTTTRWQRHAEISCDRAGLLCGGSLHGSASALFKLASGLSTSPGAERIEAFIDQARELEAEYSGDSTERVATGDWLATHPFSPSRLVAARIFCRSTAFLEEGAPLAEVDREVEALLGLMEANYLDEDSEAAEAMRRLLFAAAAVVAGAVSPVTPDEVEALSSLLGAGRVPRELKPELLAEVLPERVARVVELVPAPRRAQVLRDLVLIARADGRIQAAERAVMRKLAVDLEIEPEFVDHVLASDSELD
jgi:hypothetical protein